MIHIRASLCLFLLVCGSLILSADEKDDDTGVNTIAEYSVSYIGNNRDKDLADLDDALSENGDFGVYGDLSDGLVSLLSFMYISVEQQDNQLIVSAAPLSGEGHDFSFIVNLLNKEIDNVVIGEVLPQPEF